jgi:hypothetical protein
VKKYFLHLGASYDAVAYAGYLKSGLLAFKEKKYEEMLDKIKFMPI